MTITREMNKNDVKKQINEVIVEYNKEYASEIMLEGQKKYGRQISRKQITPHQMSLILEMLSKNQSISSISRTLNFSRKAISTNLNKCKNITYSFVVGKVKQKSLILQRNNNLFAQNLMSKLVE